MKQPLLLTVLALATFFYFYSPSASSPSATAASVQPAAVAPAAPRPIVVAQAPPSYARWKTGPNAQTDFEPFAPNEQATWNQSPGYTIISGATIR